MQLNENIKRLIIDVCGRITYLTVIFFFFTLLLYVHNEIEEALKEAWTVSTSFLGVLATLGAAIIAANLFNDWRNQHNKSIEKELIFKVINKFDQFDSIMFHFEEDFRDFNANLLDLSKLSDDQLLQLDSTLLKIVHRLDRSNLELGYYYEELRRYDIVFKTNYYEKAKEPLKQLCMLIGQLLSLQVNPNIYSMQDFVRLKIDAMKKYIIILENEINNELLEKSKA